MAERVLSPLPITYPLVFRRLPRAATIATYSEPQTLQGSSARVAADRGMDVNSLGQQDHQHLEAAGRMNRSRAAKPAQQPTEEDAIKPGTCTRCGLVGDHRTAAVCIDSLRSKLADLR